VPKWSNWQITVGDGLDGLYGHDYIAGGSENDTIFGQRGNDVIQGDGSIASRLTGPGVGASRDGAGNLVLTASAEAATDGSDYIEGNDGNDVLFGNLGQDDIVGGSSSLFGLTTPSQRGDGSDLIFGGAGTDLARNFDDGDTSSFGHGRDADMILGDNGNIFRIVGTNGTAASGQVLSFTYDNYTVNAAGANRIVVRAAQLLDYTPGGPDFNAAAAAGNLGTGDEIHGESGDDFIYGMKGNDALFGEGQDDDLIGGYGHDWISGGTGQDGVLGDDGRIFTSRNSSSYGESLYGIAPLLASDPNTRFNDGNVLNEVISTPGDVQIATINVAGELKKTVDLTPFNVDPADNPVAFDPQYADDIIYGGLGTDFLHGGSGDDAISGAEAMGESYIIVYNADRTVANAIRSDYGHPFNPGDALEYKQTTGEFAAYDEYAPRKQIVETYQGTPRQFFLNFNANEGVSLGSVNSIAYYSDGNDLIFGDLGNDWIVGGTGRDHLYGGWGDDLLNADDNLGTNGGLNDVPDTHTSYEDLAYGGAGRDRLIGNTGGDRLIDWAGEFNSYIVPFAPFGNFTISRALQPQLPSSCMRFRRATAPISRCALRSTRCATASRSPSSVW
jgi:Ca2+-binding RTX toxin-like protein